MRIALASEMSNIDDLLPRLRPPVLLLYKTMAFGRTTETARTMLASIPGAQLVALEDDGDLYGYPRDSHKLIEAIDDFVGTLTYPKDRRLAGLPSAEEATVSVLTVRERQLLSLVARGCTNREVAGDLKRLVNARSPATSRTSMPRLARAIRLKRQHSRSTTASSNRYAVCAKFSCLSARFCRCNRLWLRRRMAVS